jgi:VWFA-related protein
VQHAGPAGGEVLRQLRERAGLAAALLLLAGASRAQQRPPQPVFPTGIASVVVDVVVLDDDGFPVAGLSKDDFELREDGELQRIDGFRVVEKTSEPIAPSKGAAPRPGEAGTEPAPALVPPRRFVLVLCRWHATFDMLSRSKQTLLRLVQQQLSEGDEVMVVDVGDSTSVVQQFTPSRQQALQSIQKKIVPMPSRSNDLQQAGTFDLSDEVMQRHTTDKIYVSLESLAAGLQRANGRKIVLLLSPPLQRAKDFGPDLRRVVSILNRSNATVYAIDIAGGLRGVAEGSGSTAISDDPLSELPNRLGIGDDVNALHALAADTGGRYFTNLNVFDDAVKSVVNENRIYYLLGYTPANAFADGRFRRIHVKLKRPGMRVLARKGYLALPARRPSSNRDASAARLSPTSPRPYEHISGRYGSAPGARGASDA